MTFWKGQFGASMRAAKSSVFGLRGEYAQFLSAYTHGEPFLHDLGAERFVELEGGCVPVEHLPLKAPAAFIHGHFRQTQQERFADSLVSKSREHKQVFEKKRRA